VLKHASLLRILKGIITEWLEIKTDRNFNFTEGDSEELTCNFRNTDVFIQEC